MRIFKVVRVSFALLVAAALACCALAAAAGAATPRCTIVGTPGPDVLHGTSHADVICGGGGDDTLIGGGGNDVLVGGAGKDKLEGGPGDDLLLGGPGSDSLSGGSGRNLLRGGAGTNSCRDGSESDCGRMPRAKAQQVESPARAPRPGEVGTTCRPGCDPPPSTPPPDVEPPVFERLAMDGTLDLAAGPGQIGISVVAWDGSGEVASVTVDLAAPDGSHFASVHLSQVKELDWHGTLPVPAGSATGAYSIETIELVDRAGNVAVLDHEELAEEVIDPTEFTVYAGPDETAPSIEGLEITPTATETSAGPVVVSLRSRVTDGQSGVQRVSVVVTVPAHAPPWSLSYGGPTRQISGTELDGTDETVLELPQWAYPGVYQVSEVELVDFAGNEARVSGAELEGRGFPTEIDVTGPGDTTAPEIVGFSLEPTTIPAAGGTVVAYVHVRDDLSGFGVWPHQGFSDVYLGLAWPPHEEPIDISGMAPELVSGGPLDATFKLQTFVGPEAPAGYYPVDYLGAYDRAENGGPLDLPELEERGWNLGFTKLP